ncbi:MAG TPA: response regulator transcription factor [Anaerolineales bacterium]
MTESSIRILLVDDHQILREGLRSLLDSEPDMVVVAEAGSAKEAIRLTVETVPNIVVMDLGLPDMSGLEAIREIRRISPGVRTVVLSMHTQREFVLQAIEAGCDGYVPKSTAHTSLLQAIRTVQSGERFLHPKVATVLMESLTNIPTEADQFNQLSDRERDVLKLTAQGYISREIADQLLLSPKTVETYRQRAMEKLGLEHRSDLIRFALRAGILDEFKTEKES